MKKKSLKKRRRSLSLLSVVLAVVMLIGASVPVGAGGKELSEEGNHEVNDQKLSDHGSRAGGLREGNYGISCGVLYDSTSADKGWQDIVDALEQSQTLGMSVQKIDAAGREDLPFCDVLYLTDSLTGLMYDTVRVRELVSYVENGGTLCVPNSLTCSFPLDFLGLASVRKIDDYPDKLKFPRVDGDLKEIQGLVSDFSDLYPHFYHFDEVLKREDYGYAAKVKTAKVLVKNRGRALYTVNRYGAGRVFWTNPLLPNTFNISGYSMTKRAENQQVFSHTTASMNQMFYSAIAAYAAKQKYGYALTRVYGYYGAPSLTWELHFEDIRGLAGHSMRDAIDITHKYQETPSFQLIHDAYTWNLRSETIACLPGESSSQLRFTNDRDEDAYSGGTHVQAGETWLTQDSIQNGGSYFDDASAFTLCAYEDVLDYDGDGRADLFTGSRDGGVYYYKGLGFSDRWKVEAKKNVTDAGGEPISVGRFSAPCLFDIDGDGYRDLLLGAGDGTISWYKGKGSLTFDARGTLIDASTGGCAFPRVADMNGDGTPDLLVGSDTGAIVLFFGSRAGDGSIYFSHSSMTSLAGACAHADLGTWLAPFPWDINRDGREDIVAGTEDGFFACLEQKEDGTFSFQKFLAQKDRNADGSRNLKTGNKSVPFLADLNGDGRTDLVAASVEFGVAVPIDSPCFPYREELAEDLTYAMNHFCYVGLHDYEPAYADPERQAEELRAHLAAMKSYGLPTEGIGVNEHTFRTGAGDSSHLLKEEYRAGLLWTVGCKVARMDGNAPEESAENVVSMPFYLVDDGEKTMLVENTSTCFYEDSWARDYSFKYGMPIHAYTHMDFLCQGGSRVDKAEEECRELADIREKYGYNFCSESDAARASAAAAHLDVSAEVRGGILTLTPSVDTKDFALYDEDVQRAVGVRVSFADSVDPDDFWTNAHVWHERGGDLFLGLDRAVTVSEGQKSSSPLMRVNMPADIRETEDTVTLDFQKDGMMQVVVRGHVSAPDSSWTVTKMGRNTMLTKFGRAASLTIRR